MVQLVSLCHSYDVDFVTATLAYLNRYPNPYAKHVLSSDTLEHFVDDEGRLHTTRVVVKTGSLPDFIKPFLGQRLQLWIIEKSVIDPNAGTLLAYSANVDHRKFIKVEEFLTYNSGGKDTTNLHTKVRFSSNFIGFKSRIEEWSRDRFTSNMNNSRRGFVYVLEHLKSRFGHI